MEISHSPLHLTSQSNKSFLQLQSVYLYVGDRRLDAGDVGADCVELPRVVVYSLLYRELRGLRIDNKEHFFILTPMSASATMIGQRMAIITESPPNRKRSFLGKNKFGSFKEYLYFSRKILTI